MSKPIQFIAVRKPAAKNSVPEYDPYDIDLFINLVHAAQQDTANQNNKRAADMLGKTRRQLRNSLRNEAATKKQLDTANRQLRIVKKKYSKKKVIINVVNTIIDVALVGFSIFGMATAVWFVFF